MYLGLVLIFLTLNQFDCLPITLQSSKAHLNLNQYLKPNQIENNLNSLSNLAFNFKSFNNECIVLSGRFISKQDSKEQKLNFQLKFNRNNLELNFLNKNNLNLSLSRSNEFRTIKRIHNQATLEHNLDTKFNFINFKIDSKLENENYLDLNSSNPILKESISDSDDLLFQNVDDWVFIELSLHQNKIKVLNFMYSDCKLCNNLKCECLIEHLIYEFENSSLKIEFNDLKLGLNNFAKHEKRKNFTLIYNQNIIDIPEHGLTGCLDDLYLNKHNLNLTKLSLDQQIVHNQNLFVGKILFNECKFIDFCSDHCLHNANCTLDENGQPICNCHEIGYTGQNCFFPIYKRNCNELKLLGFRSNGFYIIDSDGPGNYSASHVYCDFTQTNQTQTLIYHNFSDETIVRTPDETPFYMVLTYRDFDLDKLKNYMNQFQICKQSIKYDCYNAPFGFGDYAWFQVLKLNGSISLKNQINLKNQTINKINSNNLDEYQINNACFLSSNWWTYETVTFFNEAITRTYFIPILLDESKNPIKTQNVWQRLIKSIAFLNTSTKPKSKFKKLMKASRNKESKLKNQARLTISPLTCSGNKKSSYEVAFSTESSYIEISYRRQKKKFELEWPYLFAKSSYDHLNENSFTRIEIVSFNFRTLQDNAGILLYIPLKISRKNSMINLINQKQNDLYFQIMIINSFEIQISYPYQEKMFSIKLQSYQKLNSGDWQLAQVFYNEQEMRVSVNTIHKIFKFDAKHLFNNFNNSLYVGGVPKIFGEEKSKIGFIGCFQELSFEYNKIINLQALIHPKLVKQILPKCNRMCTQKPCKNDAICIEHWSFRRCVCSNRFAHYGFNCEVNLNENSVTMITKGTSIHMILNRNFNKFLTNELNEFYNQNTMRTLIDMNADLMFKNGFLQTTFQKLNLLNVTGVRNLHKSEEQRWNELVSIISNLTRFDQQTNLGFEIWNKLDKGKLKMMVQLEFRTRVKSGLLFYANDNLNNFVQLHFIEGKRICLTFNTIEKIIRTEIILEDNLLTSGESIQLRLKRYLEYTVFHVLVKQNDRYQQKIIYIKVPFQFLSIYTHKPFKFNTDFDQFSELQPDSTHKFVNFHSNHQTSNQNSNQQNNLQLKNNFNLNKNSNDRFKFKLNTKTSIKNQDYLEDENAKSETQTEEASRRRFYEQIVPLRRYYMLQTNPTDNIIELSENLDNIETLDFVLRNLSQNMDDEKMFLKHLNIIYRINLNNFDKYFGVQSKTNLTNANFFTLNTTSINYNSTLFASKKLISNNLNSNGTIDSNSSSQNKTNAENLKKQEDTNYTQIYIGNVDGNNTLSTLPGFVGCISGVIFNNQLINFTKVTEKRYENELKNGKILSGCKMLCSIKNCQNSGKCLDDWINNKTRCDCRNTSYRGERCEEDFGSIFNSFDHLFYRLYARMDLLNSQVKIELAFNFDYVQYFIERSRYYYQENEEIILHPHQNRFNQRNLKIQNNLFFDNRIILLIIYETRYVLISLNRKNDLIISDVDNKGNDLTTTIENQNNFFFDQYRHYLKYDRQKQMITLDDKEFKVILHKDVVKHYYLPSQAAYGIYVAGKPKKDRRFVNYSSFSGCISNVLVTLNNQTFEPFNSAFNAVNISLVTVKGSIRQSKCAKFKSSIKIIQSKAPFRKAELLNLKWNVEESIKFFFDNEQKPDSYEQLFLKIIFLLIILFILLIANFLIYFYSKQPKKTIKNIKFKDVKQLRKKNKTKSLDSFSEGEIKLLINKKTTQLEQQIAHHFI